MVQTLKTQTVNLQTPEQQENLLTTGKSILLNQWHSFSCSLIKSIPLNNTLWQLAQAYQLKY